jgi:hypothetical protein
MLDQLHRQRRLLGRPGGLEHFITPLADGLVFGQFQKNDFDGLVDVSDAFPILMEFRDGLVSEIKLRDYDSTHRNRLMVIARTYVGMSELKDTQRQLKLRLERYILHHRALIECWRCRTRLAFDADHSCGREHYKLYVVPPIDPSQLKEALAELDEITLSPDWTSEIDRSVENLSRRRKTSAS